MKDKEFLAKLRALWDNSDHTLGLVEMRDGTYQKLYDLLYSYFESKDKTRRKE